MKDYDELISSIRKLRDEVSELYIYGAGFYGKDIYRALRDEKIQVDGFLVTQLGDNLNRKTEIPIIEADRKIKEDIGIVLAVRPDSRKEIMEYLKNSRFKQDRIVEAAEWIMNAKGMDDLRDMPGIEVTTVIGCKVDCKYCPQSLLLKRYFKDNPNRKRILELEDFKVMLSHLPPDYIVMFCGYAEPFLNPNAVELLKIACDSDHKVKLYTTLVGITKEQLEEVVKLPIDYCMVHVADRKGYAKILENEEYYDKLRFIINARKLDGSNFVSAVSAQAETSKEVAEICGKKLKPLISVQDRGGNLEKTQELDTRIESLNPGDRIGCVCIGAKLNTHVVLPDGTVTLCQSDYGLRHELGNLITDDIEKIRRDKPFQEVWEAVTGKSNMTVLCHGCLLAQKIES